MNKITPIILLSLAAFPALSQSFVSGKLLDPSEKKPIAYANIWMDPGQLATASLEDGSFRLAIPEESKNARLRVSCLGYSSRTFSIDSLIGSGRVDHLFYLKPYVQQLELVTIRENKLTPTEIVQESIKAIPANYAQQPFNMEYYSKISTKDSLKVVHTLETICFSYREGYKENGENFSEIIQKRISGKSIFNAYDRKRKIEYFTYEWIPMFDVFLCDMVGVGKRFKHTVFNPDYFRQLEFRQKGLTNFDSSPVVVIEYDKSNFRKDSTDAKLQGALYISLNDFAIVRHVRKIGKNYYEVNYKKQDGLYFPYLIRTKYPESKLPNGNYTYEVVNEIVITRIITSDVRVIKAHVYGRKDWHIDDVPFDKNFWDKYYPSGN